MKPVEFVKAVESMETTSVTTVKKTFVETTEIAKPQVAEPEKVVVTRILKKIPK